MRSSVALLLALLTSAAGAATRDLLVDPMLAADGWQLGGRRINYTLGRSSVSISQRDPKEPSLALTYDFSEPRRDYLSYYHVGPSFRGVCREFTFQLSGNESNCRLVFSIEDAHGQWFKREYGRIDWDGWREVRCPIGDGDGWQRLGRRGESPVPLTHPVKLREIAVYRGGPDQPDGMVRSRGLHAVCEVEPADFVDATLTTNRPANLFFRGESPALEAALTTLDDQPIRGELSATVTDYFQHQQEVALGRVEIVPGQSLTRRLELPPQPLGFYQVELQLTTPARQRFWRGRFAVSERRQPQPPDPQNHFGVYGDLAGLHGEQLDQALQLSTDAGLRWVRLGVNWAENNPAPGRFAWDGPSRVDGIVGRALRLDGQIYEIPNRPVVDLRDAITLAAWCRPEQDAAWQWPIAKLGGAEADRAYGIFFSRSNGNFVFSAGFDSYPNVGHHDLDSGVSGWDGKWHHYAATYDRATKLVLLYVDGKLVKQQPLDGGQLRSNSGPLRVGSSYRGEVDELVVYGRALSAAEIAGLASKQPAPTAGLAAHWSFDDPNADLTDSSPNHLDIASAMPRTYRLAKLAKEHGILTLGILGFPARWASTAPPDEPRPHTYAPDLEAWAAYAEAVAKQYRGVIDHWEIWNEPNITVFWNPDPAPEQLWPVIQTGYPALKRGNPDCVVMTPGLAGPHGGGNPYLDRLIELGLPKYCDAISIHPYRQTTPEESDLVGELTHWAELCDQHGGRRPFWYTEMCWTNQLPGGSTERRTARLLARCQVLSLGSGLVDKDIWFRLHDPGVDRFYTEHNYGLTDLDLTPKFQYFAQAAVAKLLERAVPDGTWDVGPQAEARCFQTPGGRIAAVWAPSGQALAAIRIGAPRVTVVDLMGNPRALPTTDGVLLLQATEDVQYLTGLSPQATGLGTPVAATVGPLDRRTGGKLTLGLRNPFTTPRTFTLDLDMPSGLGATPWKVSTKLRGNGTDTVEIEVATPGKPGWYVAGLRFDLDDRSYTQTLRLGVRSAPADAKAIGVWLLDEGSGTKLADSSGRRHDGTVTNPRWVPGRHGQALEFAGGSDIAVIPDTPELNLRDAVTLTCWLKLTADTGTWQFPVTKYLNENQLRNYGFYLRPGELSPAWSASYEDGTFHHNDVAGAPGFEVGRWYHLAASYDMFDGRVRLWIDGARVIDQAVPYGALKTTTAPLRFGVGTKGVIDEVRVYPRALSDDEVAALAQP